MKINGNIRRGVWVLAIVFLAGLDAAACTCELPWPKRTVKQQVNRARKDSRAVFSGSVLKIDEAGYMLKVTLKVENSWKGFLPTEVVVLTGRGGGDCGYGFEVGEDYLVYAYGRDLDHLGTNICQRTAPLSGTGSDLKHAQILLEDGKYFIEDLESRHGIFVNGQKVARHELRPRDRIQFGVEDSYRIEVGREAPTANPLIKRVVEMPALKQAGDLGRLSAVLEVARSLQASLSLDDILITAVDAALLVTEADRGFLMLKSEQGELEVRVARDRSGGELPEGELRIPRNIIQKALLERRDLLSMSFDPVTGGSGLETEAKRTILALEIRSVYCVPLVRIRIGQEHETSRLSPKEDTLGLLYMDSKTATSDLSASNRELLQTLAIESPPCSRTPAYCRKNARNASSSRNSRSPAAFSRRCFRRGSRSRAGWSLPAIARPASTWAETTSM